MCASDDTYILLLLLDVNECALLNGQCTQTCTNTPGSFLCSCDSGYVLNSDGLTCTGKSCTPADTAHTLSVQDLGGVNPPL